MTLATAPVTVRTDGIRMDADVVARILRRIQGRPTTAARHALRFEAGVVSAPLSRVLEQALVAATRRGLDPGRLVVAGWQVTDGEPVRRLRRMAHGVADWIVTPTVAVTLELSDGAAGASVPASANRSSADANAVSPARGWADPRADPRSSTHRVLRALSSVIDPDLGINIVDLGFVRRVDLDDGRLELQLTLTNPFCPLTSVIADQVRTAVAEAGIASDLHIAWAFDPPWTPADTTQQARDELQAIGISWR